MSDPVGPRRNAQGGLVYSTESGRMCPLCRKPVAQCDCNTSRRSATASRADGVARLELQTKGRGGKSVTVIRDLALSTDALAALGKRLRGAVGAGGTAKDGILEIQGDHRDKVATLLQAEGWAVKRVGGP